MGKERRKRIGNFFKKFGRKLFFWGKSYVRQDLDRLAEKLKKKINAGAIDKSIDKAIDVCVAEAKKKL